MESEKAKRRLLAIAVLGVLCVGGAFGVRYFYRKPIQGKWLGFVYYEQDGKLQKDLAGGQYIVLLKENGEFEENGNDTSGTYLRKGDQILLTPQKFRGKTPEELRVQYHTKDGKLRPLMRNLLNRIMKPSTMTYVASKDQMTLAEDTLQFVFDRAD